MASYRPRHRHSPDNSPHSFCIRILAPALWFALSMDLFLCAQIVSTCFCLRWLMAPRHLLVHDSNIGRAWRCAALGMHILQITHLIPFVFVSLRRLFVLHYSLVKKDQHEGTDLVARPDMPKELLNCCDALIRKKSNEVAPATSNWAILDRSREGPKDR